LVFCILNREDREDRKEIILAHLAAGQLDSVMDREEAARHIVDSYPYPIRYKEVVLDCGYRADLLVTVDVIHPVHRAQLLTYLKLSGRSIGFLINWKVPRIKDGIQRMIRRER
jgi:GxxExxY protein